MQAIVDNTLFVESGGAVVMEAEKYTSTTPGTGTASGSSWQSTTSISGYQGSSAMQAVPDSGVNTGLLTNGPALNYKINFQTIGTYYVYVRGYGPLTGGASDSIHIGLDGVAVTTSAGSGLSGFNDSGFTWRSKYNGVATTINVTTTGLHTLNLWMREDGVVVDRIWLSTTAQSVEGSTSTGPAETATNGAVTQYVQSNQPAAATQYKAQFMFDPNTLTATGSTTVLFSGRDSDAGGASLVELLFKNYNGTYQIRTRIKDNAGAWVDGAYQNLSDQAHTIGIYWAAATNDGANDGYVKLSIDGFVKDQVTGVDNDTRLVEMARLGVVSAPPIGTTGTLYFDNFQSWGTIATPYRITEYDYATNTSPSVWILDKVKRQTLTDESGNILSETRYGYDGTANGIGAKGDLTFTQVVGQMVTGATSTTTVTLQVSSSGNDVNEDGASYTTTDSPMWIGNGSATSYAGLRFTGVNIPAGATITSAHLEAYSAQTQWISMAMSLLADASGNSPAFSSSSKPSQRTLTTQQVNHSSNTQWQADTWYSLNEMASVVQAVVSRADWTSGNSLSIVLKGSGGPFGRKFIKSADSGASTAPKLVITYQTTSTGITTNSIDTAYIYDTYGNVIKTCMYTAYGTPGSLPTAACSGTSSSFRASTVTYDTGLKTYAISQTNPLSQTVAINYTGVNDLALGLPSSVTDINGNTTATTYDGLGRVKTLTYPGFAQANVQYTYPTPPITAPFKVQLQAWDETASLYRSAWTFYDGLGRPLQSQAPSETSGQFILTDTKYDARSLTLYAGLPRQIALTGGTYSGIANWATVPHSTFTYDALGRPTQTTFADSTHSDAIYDGLKTTFRDQKAHQKVQYVDAFGRLVTVEEYTGNSTYTLYGATTYQYDVRNLLQQVTDTSSNVTTITYDGFGRKAQMIDPDMGDWRYRYDTLGNLTAQIDNRRKAVNFYYDTLNRLTGKTFTAGPVNPDTYQPPADPGYSGYTTKYYYDAFTAGSNYGKGHRTSMVDSVGTTTWTYNALGQMKDETHAIGSSTYKMCNTYDAFGRIRTQNYPSTSDCTGETLNYGYNAMGTLESVSGAANYITGIAYAASGQVNETYLGNGVVSQSCYNANTLRITSIRAYPGAAVSCTNNSPANARLNLQYQQYDNAGNVTQVLDATRSETSTFTYDDLDRLLSVNATVGSAPYSQSYGYDPIGNLTSKAGVTLTYTAQAGTCPDGALTKPHAVTSAGSDAYCYDKNGSMVKRTESGTTYTQNFDTENRITSIVTGSQTTTFVYDGDGALAKKIRPDNTYTLYLGGIYEVDLSSGGSVTKKTSYYPGGAMRVDVVGGSNTLYYLLKDHLGSASVVLDNSGVLIANGEQRYYPYGEKRITTAALPTDRLYTGQLELASLGGIYSYGARFYSPKLGRFLSADTVVPSPYNPQSLNRFSYVLNNPLKYTDPTGHVPSYCQQYPAECQAEMGGGAPIYHPPAPPPSNGGSDFSNLYTPIVTNDLPKCCITVAEPDNGPKCCITVVEPDNGPKCCITIIQPVVGPGCCITIVEEISGFKCCITIVERRDDGLRIVTSSTLEPGPYAGDSIPARGPGTDFTAEERKKIDTIGFATGCHTCGSKNPGTLGGHFVPDHQPISALNTDNQPQRLYPQCKECSFLQGGEVRREQWRRKKEAKNAG